MGSLRSERPELIQYADSAQKSHKSAATYTLLGGVAAMIGGFVFSFTAGPCKRPRAAYNAPIPSVS